MIILLVTRVTPEENRGNYTPLKPSLYVLNSFVKQIPFEAEKRQKSLFYDHIIVVKPIHVGAPTLLRTD